MTERRQFCPRGHDTFLVGRDSSYRCLECKRLGSQAARDAREAEAQAVRMAEQRRINKEAERRREREHKRALAAGGDIAANARWRELWKRSPNHDLCQWALESGLPGACTNHTQEVFCGYHNRLLDREQARKREARKREREGTEHDRNTSMPDLRADHSTQQDPTVYFLLP